MVKLARLHAEITTDWTLLAISVAAEEVAARWRQEHDHLNHYWLAYEKELAVESEARRTLDMLLRTLAKLAESPLTSGGKRGTGSVHTSRDSRLHTTDGRAACRAASFG
jgi:hypothetical protein